MHHAVGVFAIVSAIAFAFGERTARVVVGGALIAMALGFAYIAVRVIEGSI
jgi:hypothetical protein